MNSLKLLVAVVLIAVTRLRQDMCASGDGRNYRGTVSTTDRGHSCLHWDLFQSWEYYKTSKGLGPHNHCRNPNQSLKPWCRVRKGRRIVREFCDIRKCEPGTELTCGERTEQVRYKIVGGTVTTSQDHPWVSAIFQKPTGFLCGGTLIAPCWVLTAAHCFADGNATQLRKLSVYLGKDSIKQMDQRKEQKFTVEQLEAKVKLLSQTLCRNTSYYEDKVTDNMFCAGSPDWSTDACQGDSGGPLVCRMDDRAFVYGVVSWGEGCGLKHKPGVYTRVTNYNQWIAESTGLPSYTTGAMYPIK
ncbi:hypothetical protein CRUP_004737 [Coryphaenoides rupestris]|nr:hypothetical protein CRUP_004737 [Coryphaenoides rupestris]